MIFLLLASILICSDYEGPIDPAGDVSAIRSSYMDGNRVYLYFENTTELSNWEDQGPDYSIWPNDGTGTRMLDGVGLLIGGKVYIVDDGDPTTIDTEVIDDTLQINTTSSLHELYFLQTHYRENMDSDFERNLRWGFYPTFGYFNPSQDYPAMSDDPNTWPTLGWPSAGYDLKWEGYWDGRFGKGVTYADLETYFVANDAMDHEHIKSDEVRYYPRPGTKIQSDATFQENEDWGGLGLRVEVRGFQWNNPLVRDALFWEYNISNISDYNITETSFGYWVDNGIGAEQGYDDEYGYFDTILDLAYSWDENNTGSANVETGIIGFAFLESPGIADDNFDNDNDGIIDESRDNSAGVWYEDPLSGIDDLGNFLDFYNLDEEDLKPHFEGDEDQDWIISEFDEEGNCLRVNDDLGLDGVGPGDLAYDGPDADGTECNGVPDCVTGVGCEPNFNETDVSESDMIGLTTFQLHQIAPCTSNQDVCTDYQTDMSQLWFYNDQMMWETISSDTLMQFTSEESNLVEIFASGIFELKKGQTERISMAELHSFDPLEGLPGEAQNPVALFELKNTVQLIYESDYRFAQPPRMPTLTAEAKDGEVLLTWDSVAESSRDPFLPEDLQYDFEGYKIYRSTDRYFRDAQIITDGYGNNMFYEPIFQCDKVDGITGFSDVTVFGTSYYLGDDTSIKHHFTDRDIINGRTYYYAVVAYDYGLAPSEDILTGIPPSENNALVEIDENEYVISTGPNVAIVQAGAPSAGYIPPEIEIDNNSLKIGTGTIEIEVIADNQIEENTNYILTFDTVTDYVERQDMFNYEAPNYIYTTGFNIFKCSDYIGDNCVAYEANPTYSEKIGFDSYGNPEFSGLNFNENDVCSEFQISDIDCFCVEDVGQSGHSPNIPDEECGYNFNNIGFAYNQAQFPNDPDTVKSHYFLNKSEVVTDVFEGLRITMDPSDYTKKITEGWYQKVTGDPQIILNESTNLEFYHRESRIVPWDFDIIFSDDESFYNQSNENPLEIYFPNKLFDIQDNYISMLEVFEMDENNFNLSYPFYVENMTLGGKMSLIGIETSGDGIFNVWEDKTLVGSVDQDGHWNGTLCEIDFAGIAENQRPGSGDIYSVRFQRPFSNADTLRFSTGDLGRVTEDYLKDDIDDIRVVPNPYVMTNLLEESIYNTDFNQRRMLMFTNLPSKCYIEIYTTSGVLVDRIEVNNSIDNGVAYWDLLTNESLEVAAGMYVYYVKSLVFNNEAEKIGKFAIIK